MKHIWPILFIFFSMQVNAISSEPIKPSEAIQKSSLNSILSIYSEQATWTFSGMVSNENNERFAYYFQIQRNNKHFHALATLADIQKKSVIVYDEGSIDIENPELIQWQIGHSFLRFNPINNSWVFGVKDKEKQGFNFKVDMLSLANKDALSRQALRPGLELMISQTGALNGHFLISSNKKEQFVTAKAAWFRQVWASKPQTTNHKMVGLLCELNDGSAFYSMTLPEADTLRGSIAGWRDAENKSLPISQFVNISDEKEGIKRVSIATPKLDVRFTNILDALNETHQVILGIIKKDKPGFCSISNDELYTTEPA